MGMKKSDKERTLQNSEGFFFVRPCEASEFQTVKFELYFPNSLLRLRKTIKMHTKVTKIRTKYIVHVICKIRVKEEKQAIKRRLKSRPKGSRDKNFVIYMFRLKNRREISSCQIKNIPKKEISQSFFAGNKSGVDIKEEFGRSISWLIYFQSFSSSLLQS